MAWCMVDYFKSIVQKFSKEFNISFYVDISYNYTFLPERSNCEFLLFVHNLSKFSLPYFWLRKCWRSSSWFDDYCLLCKTCDLKMELFVCFQLKITLLAYAGASGCSRCSSVVWTGKPHVLLLRRLAHFSVSYSIS